MLIKEFKKYFCDCEYLPSEKIRIIYENQIIDDNYTFDELNIPNNSILSLDIKLYCLFLSAHISPPIRIFAEEGATKEELIERLKIFDVYNIEKEEEYFVNDDDYISFS